MLNFLFHADCLGDFRYHGDMAESFGNKFRKMMLLDPAHDRKRTSDLRFQLFDQIQTKRTAGDTFGFGREHRPDIQITASVGESFADFFGIVS